MAIGRITGQMLFPNLERQGVDLQVDTDLAYFDVNTRRLGIKTDNPQQTLDVRGNAQLGNLSILGNTISSDTGRIGLGSINNITLTGGQPNYIVYTDGAGNLEFGNLNTLSLSEGFTGNNIALGTNTYGQLSGNALTFTVDTRVTDAIAEIAFLLGNITNHTGDTINTGNLRITSGIDSTNSTTGAVQVIGGIGVTGNLNIGGNINIPTGNIVINNSAFFVGNIDTGFGALYAGIPSGYETLPQLVAQYSANYNGYAQVNLQNINSGSLASSDFVATADNGNDSANFVDLGIASSTYSYPAFSSIRPNDSYLYANGGNLILITDTVDKNINFAVGGGNLEHIAVQINHPNTVSTSPTTGTLVVYGDTGLTGNVVIGGTIPFANITTANVDQLNANTISLNGSSTFTNLSGGNVTAGNVLSTFYGNVHTDYIFANTTSITMVPGVNGVVAINSPTAIKVPVGTISERPVGVEGYLRYNTEAGSLEFFDGVKWVSTSSILDSQMIESANGEDVTFTLSYGTTASAILVSINGVIQQPNGSNPAYSVSGDQITFSQPPQATDIIDIRYISSSVVPDLTNYLGNIGQSQVTIAGITIGSATTTNVGVVETVLDSFPVSYHGAKYVVSTIDTITSEFQTAEIILAHNNTTSFINTHSVVYTGASNVMTFTSNIVAGNVFLYGTGVSTNNTVKLSKTLL